MIVVWVFGQEFFILCSYIWFIYFVVFFHIPFVFRLIINKIIILSLKQGTYFLVPHV